MVWFAGLMVNAILRPRAIIIKSKLAILYGRLMAQLAQKPDRKPFRFESRFENREQVHDADFETLAAGVILEKGVTHVVAPLESNGPEIQSTNKIGMSVFEKNMLKPAPDDVIAFYGFSAALVMLSFWAFGGHTLFRNVDFTTTSSIQTQRALPEIADASWRVVTIDDRSALHVEGIVRNSGNAAMHAKPVVVTVKDHNGTSKRYLLGQKGWTLGPGQEVVVSGRLDIGSASIASVVIALSN
jgi:hypothetical protein